MKKIIKNFLFLLNCIRIVPHWIVFNIHAQKETHKQDIFRWAYINNVIFNADYSIADNVQIAFFQLIAYFPGYRNLFYHRCKGIHILLNFLYHKVESVELHSDAIGSGLYFRHSNSIVVNAKSIGKNCTIYQQVTIGSRSTGEPVIGDNVTIFAGAKILGGITIGDNAVIGANTLVLKDIPANHSARNEVTLSLSVIPNDVVYI